MFYLVFGSHGRFVFFFIKRQSPCYRVYFLFHQFMTQSKTDIAQYTHRTNYQTRRRTMEYCISNFTSLFNIVPFEDSFVRSLTCTRLLNKIEPSRSVSESSRMLRDWIYELSREINPIFALAKLSARHFRLRGGHLRWS